MHAGMTAPVLWFSTSVARRKAAMGKGIADYVLIYPKKHELSYQVQEYIRKVQEDGCLTVEEEELAGGDEILVNIVAPFTELSKAAESLRLCMPLLSDAMSRSETAVLQTKEINGCYTVNKDHWQTFKNLWSCFMQRIETEPDDELVSAVYTDNEGLFEVIDDKDSFFRPSLRYLLTHHILTNIDASDGKNSKVKMGLLYLQMKGAIRTSFILHDPRPYLQAQTQTDGYKYQLQNVKCALMPSEDSREELDKKWAKASFKLSPLTKIRNYFGEKIALYFAFVQILHLTLIFPAFLGLCIFVYGLHLSITCHHSVKYSTENLIKQDLKALCLSPVTLSTGVNRTLEIIREKCYDVEWRRRLIEQTLNQTCTTKGSYNSVQETLSDASSIIKYSLDNNATPIFALILCLWGTVFLEIWKRKNASLSHKWKVKDYESNEPDRPEFKGILTKKDLVTGDEVPYYPTSYRYTKIFASFSVLLVLVGFVCISVLGVVVYKTWARIKVKTENSFQTFLLSTVLSSLMNAISMTILGQVYEKIAIKMTDWENYRTQTAYNDALIKKLFAFQFANSYASLFYIAFLRRNNQDVFNSLGFVGLEDDCGMLNNCISDLSVQLLVVMIVKTLPKFCNDLIYPWLKKIICKRCNKEDLEDPETTSLTTRFILDEERKPDLGNFTLGEYNEKVIQYGYQMIFAACFPLGPLLFFFTLLVDKKVDSKRLLWIFRRPLPWIAQDIGPWFAILEIINAVAVVTNACLIAFSSQFSRERPLVEQLMIFIIFEHIVFIVKFIVANAIPDLPQKINWPSDRYIFVLDFCSDWSNN
uniref:Anoctamin n=1 Tax=Erpetoichthys calabaricus TaxID=27687 RepID=A0A8C4X8J1_ERPCA